MPTYTVQQASHKMDRPDGGYGPMQIIGLTLTNGSEEPVQAEWYTKRTTPIPTPGSTLEGDLVPGKYGAQWDFKRARQQGGGGGQKGRSPQDTAAIQRMHDQDMALRAVELATKLGLVQPSTTAELFVLIASTADWFGRDTAQAKAKA